MGRYTHMGQNNYKTFTILTPTVVGCLRDRLVPLLVDVAELDFPHLLDERGRMAEYCHSWVDLPCEAVVSPRVTVVVPPCVAVVVPPRVAVVVPPRVAVVPPCPHVFVLGIRSFFGRPYR